MVGEEQGGAGGGGWWGKGVLYRPGRVRCLLDVEREGE